MMQRLLPGLGVLVLTSSSLAAQTLKIDHQPVACAVAEKFPRLEARFAPGDAVATARVLFQPENTQQWYAVAMKSEGPAFSGVLPKPKKSLKAFRYYIEVTDKALGTNRTADFTTNVVANSGECKGKIVAAALGSASVLLQVPAGAAALPAGFASTGVVAAGSGSAAAGAAGVATGGGISTTTLVVAGAGVLAAGAAVAVASSAGHQPEERGVVAQVSGQVFGSFGPNPSNPTGPGLYSDPVAGAVVSTSLDSVTTTTGGDGRFNLITQTRLPNTTGCTPFTLTIRASGYPTYSLSQNWVGSGKIISLVPPMPNASSSSPCVP